MPLYAVRLHGAGLRVPILKRRWRLLGRRVQVGDLEGFYATRFIEADSQAAAETQAIELVRAEVSALPRPDPASEVEITVEESSPDPDVLPAGGPPGGGFTFY